LIALAVVTWTVHAQETPVANEGNTAQPVGAWRVFVSPELPGDPVFVNLSVFHTDGALVGFPPASPFPDGTVVSGSTGLWRRASIRDFDVVFYSTMYNGDLLAGYQRVRARIQLTDEGRGFLGRFTNDILDPDDNVVASITGTVTGKRILIN
jgi:hypothetical protein